MHSYRLAEGWGQLPVGMIMGEVGGVARRYRIRFDTLTSNVEVVV